ncbi:MAG: MFS transporter [Planctomycetota bacterium]
MKLKRYPLGAVFLTVVVDLIGFGIVMPLLPLYAKDYGITGTQMGFLLSSFSLMQFLFAPVWGKVSDRVGRKPVLLIGLAGSVVFYTVFGFATSYAWLLVARIGAGIAGATISTAAAYIADVTTVKERARGMALIGAAFGIGFVVGAPLGLYSSFLGKSLAENGHVSDTLARAVPGLIASAISAFSFAWTWHSVREPERHKPAKRALFDLSALRRAHSPRALTFLLVLSFCSVFTFANFEGTLSLMLEDRFLYDEKEMGKVWLFLGITLALAQGFLVRRLMKTFSERTMIRGGFALIAAGLFGVAFLDTRAGLYASLAFAVTGFGSVTPSISALVSRHADPTMQGGTMGLAQSASSLGRIFGPMVGNIVYAPVVVAVATGDPAAAATTGDRTSDALTAMVAPLFGSMEHHRRSFVLAAGLAAALFGIALTLLPPAPPESHSEGTADEESTEDS